MVVEIVEFPVGERPRIAERDEIAAIEGYHWLDYDREPGFDWAADLHRRTGLEIFESHVRDSMNPEHPSFTDRTDDYEMIVFRGVVPDDATLGMSTFPVAFFLFDHWLVTIHPPGPGVQDAVRAGMLAGRLRIPRRPAGLTHSLLHAMVDRFLDLRERLSEQLETWQRDLLDPANPFNDWRLLMDHGNALRRIEARCEEQHTAVVEWMENTRVELDDSLRVRLEDLKEHIRRVLSFTQHAQGQIESLVQMHFSAVAHRTNEIVRVLTVISAIFLPLTFLAGIFGMNFRNMPETQTEYGYFVALGAMGALALVLLVVFRKNKWI